MTAVAAALGRMHDSGVGEDGPPQGRAFVTSGAARLVAALALLALVAFASTTRLSGRSTFGPTPVSGIALMVVVVVLGALVLFGLVIAGAVARGEKWSRTKVLATVLATLLLVALVASLLSIKPRGLRSDIPSTKTTHAGGPGKQAKQKGDAGEHQSSLPSVVAGASLLALLLLAGAAAALAGRRRPVVQDAPPENPVLQALDESLDDLRAERDVRRAIIACYARMERALARTGASRRASETPFEFLARVLEHIARGPGRVLTDLFERAKFSTEPLGDADKQQAIGALEALRTQAAQERA
jgi:hypothetical protein